MTTRYMPVHLIDLYHLHDWKKITTRDVNSHLDSMCGRIYVKWMSNKLNVLGKYLIDKWTILLAKQESWGFNAHRPYMEYSHCNGRFWHKIMETYSKRWEQLTNSCDENTIYDDNNTI